MDSHSNDLQGNNGEIPFLHGKPSRLLLFGGKGGVGKTTCAAATALRLARLSPQQAFLLVSTDPAHSLADSMAELIPPANLTVLEFDAQKHLDDFKASHREKLQEIAARGTFLDDEDIKRFLDLSLPGLDELMAWIEISAWLELRKYETIIMDTAPTGHTLRLLAMPGVIRKWLRALDALLAKHRFLRQHFQKTTSRDELDDFVQNIWTTLQRMEKVLRDPKRCRFVPVMLAEELSIRNTMDLLEALRRLKIHASDIVVNRLYPENDCPACMEVRNRQLEALGKYEGLSLAPEHVLWGVPQYAEEVRGERLESFWAGINRLVIGKAAPFRSGKALAPIIETPPPCPPASTNLLIFAGKGGVGKTTLACATAVRMALEYPGIEVFLFSADPAHSISDCLGIPVGPKVVNVFSGLLAMEIDATAAFASLKQEYRHEIEGLLATFSAGFEMPFDREVVERILDLSPPGVDEIMALTSAMEFLEQGERRILILDAAPTGHLVRLLELPDVIEKWLKAFFDILLKYDLAIRMPLISRRLVSMSKRLKILCALWRNSERAAAYAVSILTWMAFQETKDLVAACGRIGVRVPVLFLNMATAQSDCPLCAALHRRESEVRDEYRRAFPEMRQALVYRRSEPRGVERLRELGKALYQ